jgi:hypothetical protein
VQISADKSQHPLGAKDASLLGIRNSLKGEAPIPRGPRYEKAPTHTLHAWLQGGYTIGCNPRPDSVVGPSEPHQSYKARLRPWSTAGKPALTQGFCLVQQQGIFSDLRQP